MPPPPGDPQDDAVCLAILDRSDVAAALGVDVGDVAAVGTDPVLSLACTYATSSGSFLLSTSAGDAASGFQGDFDNAGAYGQSPAMVEGLGDQAFYAKTADRWPEQLVFTKGPVLVRLWNQTSATIGSEKLTALATTVADSIRTEIPPAP
jgi:hypothetical protein